ncbi:MAG TPA: hypothetical protein VGC96_10045, partial [Candidatus Elarobacter sp.]
DGRAPLQTTTDGLFFVYLDASYGGQSATFVVMGASIPCALTNDVAGLTDDEAMTEYTTGTNTVLVPLPPDVYSPTLTIP